METTEMPPDPVITKIQALLRLAHDEGATEAEAALAAERAAELMEKHAIDEASLALDAGDPAAVGVDEATFDVILREWKIDLANALANGVGGICIYSPNQKTTNADGTATRTPGTITFLAPGGTGPSLRELFRYLERTLSVASAEAEAPPEVVADRRTHADWRLVWLNGAVARLGARLAERLAAREAMMNDPISTAGKALTVIHDRVAEEYERRLPSLRDRPPHSGPEGHDDAFSSGWEKGGAIPLGDRALPDG
jgi:hypothetical protein